MVIMQGLLIYLYMLLCYTISNYLLIIALFHHRFIHIIWDFLGRISELNTVCTFVSHHIFLYIYSYTWLLCSYINVVSVTHHP